MKASNKKTRNYVIGIVVVIAAVIVISIAISPLGDSDKPDPNASPSQYVSGSDIPSNQSGSRRSTDSDISDDVKDEILKKLEEAEETPYLGDEQVSPNAETYDSAQP